MSFLGGLIGAIGTAAKGLSQSKGSGGRGTASSSAYDQWLKDNPSYFVSSQDDAFARSNQSFASGLMRDKAAYYKAYGAGDQAGMQSANNSLNSVRDVMGGYMAGQQGDRYDVTRPYTNAAGISGNMRQGNNDLARDVYAKTVEAGTHRLKAQKGELNRSYDDAAQKAYISYMQGQRDMPQQMASLGMTGGASESALLGAQASYQGNQNHISTGRNKALSEVDLAIQDLISSGDLQTAQYILQNAEKNADNYLGAAYSDVGRRDTLDQQTIQNAYAQAGLTGMYQGAQTLDGQQFAFQKEQYEYQKLIEQAQLAAAHGDYSKLRALGIQIDETQGGRTGGRAGGGNGGSGRAKGGKVTAGVAEPYEDPKTPKDPAPSTALYDRQSVLALGYGPIDAESLDALIADGKVLTSEKNGKLYVYRREGGGVQQGNAGFSLTNPGRKG